MLKHLLLAALAWLLLPFCAVNAQNGLPGVGMGVPVGYTPNYQQALASPITQTFMWSGSNSTSVPAASSTLAQPPIYSTVYVTAGTGVTNLVAQVQATNDNSTWTTVSTLSLTAPGTADVTIAIPYLGLRVNVTTISGGSASATLTTGQAPLSTSGGTVQANPTLTGITVPSAYLFAQWGLPVILPSSGSIANNGALTLTTALPTTFPNCWMYFPAGAISSGSAAGVYFVQMSSTTVGTIYNNVLSSGAPFIPASPTPFSTTGPGAYTQTTSATFTMVSIPLLGGSLGNNGAIRYKGVWLRPNNADTVSNTVSLGGTQIALVNAGSQIWTGFERTLRNMGSQASQVSINATTNFQTDAALAGSSTSFLSINTANTQNLVFGSFLGTATDYTILAGVTVEILPAN